MRILSGNSRSTAQLPASSAGSVLGRGWDRTSVWGPLGSVATSCSVGGLGQVTKAPGQCNRRKQRSPVSQRSGSSRQSVFSSKAGRKQPPWNFIMGRGVSHRMGRDYMQKSSPAHKESSFSFLLGCVERGLGVSFLMWGWTQGRPIGPCKEQVTCLLSRSQCLRDTPWNSPTYPRD